MVFGVRARKLSGSKQSLSCHITPAAAATREKNMSTIIEHVVLFKVKDDASPSEVDAMVDRINSLASLEHLLHLTMAPLLRVRSSSSLNFTHILHARYGSKIDLEAYTVHPSHVAVVRANAPFCDDTMALDWVAEDLKGELVIPPPGSPVRVSFYKLKAGLGDRVRDEALRAIREIQQDLKGAVQNSCGENFSPGRAKGFSVASIVVFPGLRELEAAGSDEKNDKIEEHLVLDYVIPSPKSAASGSNL